MNTIINRAIPLILVFAFAGMLRNSVNAAQPSFDCGKARNWSELEVCRDTTLADLDVRLASLYANQGARLEGAQKGNLIQEQRKWLAERETCKLSNSTSQCLVALYNKRIAELSSGPSVQGGVKTQPFALPSDRPPTATMKPVADAEVPEAEHTHSPGKNINAASVENNVFKDLTCNSYAHYGAVKLYVDENKDLSDQQIASYLLAIAAEYVRKNCQYVRGYSNISVLIDYKSQISQDIYGRNAPIVARNYDNDKLTWREYSNKAALEKARRLANARMNQQMERDRQEAERRRLDEQRTIQEKREKLLAFFKNTDVVQVLDLSQIAANSFLYEGKIIASLMDFSRMTSRDEALFSKGNEVAIVFDIPEGKFVQAQEFLLAGRVKGNKAWKTPFGGEMLVPLVKYIDAFEGLYKYSPGDIEWAKAQAGIK